MLYPMRTVLVHGLAGSSRWWRRLEPRLGALDLDAVDLPRTADLDELDRWLEQRLAPRANLVGHSLGGLLATRVAARRPDLVERLALIAPAGIPGRSLTGHALPLAHTIARLQPRLFPVAVHDALRAGPLHLLWTARRLVAADIRAELARVVAPTLVIWGEHDRLVPVRHAAEWEAALANVRVELLPRTGHVPMAERPDEVSRLLLGFLHEPR
jgi:pimeloyl-ACP methyl ester carboxylesterase